MSSTQDRKLGVTHYQLSTAISPSTRAGVTRELPLVLRVGEANVMNQEKDEDTERRHAAAQSKASSEIGSTSGETTF